MTTSAPAAVRASRTRVATSQVTVASGNPPFVAVPVVLQAFVFPPPASTCLLISLEKLALPSW